MLKARKTLCVFLSVLMIIGLFSAVPFSAADKKVNHFDGSDIKKQSVLKKSSAKKENLKKKIKPAEYAEGEAIVILKKSAPSKAMKKSNASAIYGKGVKINSSFDVKSKDKKKEIKGVCLKSSIKSTEELITEAENNPNVKYAIPNFYEEINDITNDTYSSQQWALENTGQNNGTPGKDTNADALWSKASSSSKDQVVAVIDTGIDSEHEDLKDVLWHNNKSSLEGEYGYNFANDSSDVNDDNGHGSHCAGIIAAAANNNKGVSGINTSHTKIMALKANNGRNLLESNVFKAFEYVSRAIDAGVNVVAVNCSFGSPKESSYALQSKKVFEEYMDLLGSKGVITCVSSGNDSLDLNTLYDQTGMIDTPACCESDYKICVGASDNNDNITDFSNYGNKYVDVMAPGENILSTVSYYSFVPSAYTQSQREDLCDRFQDFSSDSPDLSEFGWNFVSKAFNGHVLGINIDSDSFGVGSNSICIGDENKDYGEGFDFYVEIPYSLVNVPDSYYISAMLKFKGQAYFDWMLCDYDVDISDKFYDCLPADDEHLVEMTASSWTHYQKKITPDSSASKNQKIVLMFRNISGPIYLDDIAVSKANVLDSAVGKYDFYDGTSMASPHVTGSVALLHNAFPDYSVNDIINIIKTTGRKTDNTYKVKNGNSLSLDKTDTYKPENPSIPDITGLRVTDVTESTISLDFDPVDISGVKYVFEKKTASGDWGAYDPQDYTGTKFSKLQPNTTYYFRVRAVVDGVYGDYSSTVSATTLSAQTTEVPAITGLKVTNVTENTISLNFDPVDISGIEYVFEKKTESGAWEVYDPQDYTGTKFSKLQPNTTYYFRVRAVSNGVYGGYSSEVSATTKSDEQTSNLNASIKLNGTQVKSVEVTGDKMTVSYNLTASEPIMSLQSYLYYDSNKLSLTDVSLPYVEKKTNNYNINKDINPCILIFSNVYGVDFSNGEVIVKAEFTKKSGATGSTDIDFRIDILDDIYETDYFLDGEATEAGEALLPSLSNPTVECEGSDDNPVVPAVTGLNSTDTSKNSVTLSWNSVNLSGADYYVEYKQSDSNDWTLYSSTRSTSITVSGLQPDTSYSFRVRAKNSGIYGGYSYNLTVKTLSDQSSSSVPKVTGLETVEVEEDGVSLSWNSVGISGAEYYVELKEKNDSTWDVYGPTTNTHGTISGDLTANTTYNVRVRAYANDEYGEYSSTIEFTTSSAESSAPAVTGLRVTDIESDSISLSWNSVGLYGAEYCVEYIEEDGLWREYTYTTSTSIDVNGLSADTYYYFRVCAYVNGKYGAYSSEVSAKTPSNTNTVPTVTGLKVIETTSDSVTIEWNPVGINGVKYYVEVKEGNGGWDVFGPSANTSAEFTDMTPNTTYIFRVRAISSGVYGGYSNEVSATTNRENTSNETNIRLSAASTRIYVGATTSVSANVTGGVGYTLFLSSDDTIASVNSNGIVSAKRVGTVTITALNNGKRASVRITVIKRANTVRVTAKTKSVKAKKLKKKKQTVKPLQVINAKGTVTVTKIKNGSSSKIYKKVKVNKRTGAITVKKGKYAKKTYKLKLRITVAGNGAYNPQAIIKTVKIKVK
jgi:subtilisin family serine protease